jgi:hypothetical protein
VRGHVDTETLAEYREDLLSRRVANRVAGHLRECAQCARLDAQLAGVSTTLARAPAPPMPDALTARITAALAAEAAARDAEAGQASRQPALGTPAADGPVTAGHPAHGTRPATRGHRHSKEPRWRGLGLRAAAATAVAVVAVGGGYGVFTLVTSGGQSGSSASNSSGAGGSPGQGGGIRPGFSQQHSGAVPALGLLPTVVHSGTNYQPGRLATQVSTVLAQSPPTATGGPVTSFGAFRHLRACVSSLTGGSLPRLVDIARYRGQQAAVIVAGIPGSREAHVWVVGPGCSAGARDVLARTMVTTVP